MTVIPDLGTIWERIGERPGAPFVLSGSGSFRYRELARTISRCCAEFDRCGLTNGARVLIATADEPMATSAFLAALLDGMVPVMLGPDTGTQRARAIADSVEPGLIIADQGFSAPDHLCEILELPKPKQRTKRSLMGGIFNRGETHTKPDCERTLPDEGRVPTLPGDLDALAYILFTSGTTRAPSGVQISRRNLLSHLSTLGRLFGYAPSSRIFNATPLAHTDGLVQGPLLAAAHGAGLIRPGPFTVADIENWLNAINRLGTTHVITTPTALALIARYAAHDDYFDGSGFVGILSSGAILSEDLWQRIEDRFRCDVFNLYGMTETVANATYAGAHPEMGPPGTIGFAIDCQARVERVAGASAPDRKDDVGELQLKGSNIFSGYWRDPERTRATMTSDGWMRTGDLVRRRTDGALEILGRLKTAINSGGTLILPEEIDEVLLDHPAVVEAVTIGLADDVFEEIAVSLVVADRALEEEELAKHCRARLEALKVPKRILRVDRIPRGDAGKARLGEVRTLARTLLDAPDRSSARDPDTTSRRLLRVANQIFRTGIGELDAQSSPDTVPAWDSFTHVNLILAIEREFDVRLPTRVVSNVATLGDLVASVRRELP